MTTPLKPLEAMALGKAVLASDLPPMRELISQDVTGLLFQPGSERISYRRTLRLLGDRGLRLRLGAAGRDG